MRTATVFRRVAAGALAVFAMAAPASASPEPRFGHEGPIQMLCGVYGLGSACPGSQPDSSHGDNMMDPVAKLTCMLTPMSCPKEPPRS